VKTIKSGIGRTLPPAGRLPIQAIQTDHGD
jgi:hypothetical protein